MVIIIIDYDNDDDSLPIIARLRFSRIPSANWPYPSIIEKPLLGLEVGWLRVVAA